MIIFFRFGGSLGSVFPLFPGRVNAALLALHALHIKKIEILFPFSIEKVQSLSLTYIQISVAITLLSSQSEKNIKESHFLLYRE